jgi:hypothetical protein
MHETDGGVNFEGYKMSRQQYQTFRFTDESLRMISVINRIIADYQEQGFTLTIRQIYYQLVSHDEFRVKYKWTGKAWRRDPNGTINAEPNYDALCYLANKARLAGLMDWEAIEDRTRNFVLRTRWETGKDILRAATDSWHMDMWRDQRARVFVIVEKDALVGVLQPTCRRLDVPILAARGYPSVSVLREFVVGDILPADEAQDIIVIHLGDHDPSGIDMTRDLRERIELFAEGRPVDLVRIALTMKQIRDQNPPPNPAKTTDTRFRDYQKEFGDESWELDALSPSYLADLLANKINEYRDEDIWEAQELEVEETRTRLDNATFPPARLACFTIFKTK